METATLNGRNQGKTPVLETEVIKNAETLTAVTPTPEAYINPQPEIKNQQGRKRLPLILAGLGVGAIAAGTFGYNYLQYTSTHEQTDNATVAGHVHQISSKIPGTVAQVLVNDNQQVQPGELLVKLDPRDYDSKVQQAAAALENARSQAEAAAANISLTSETTNAKTTQAQGDIGGAVAAISTAQAAVQEAQGGVPAAQADVKLAEAGITAAQAQVAQVNANLQKAKTDYTRYNSLYQEGAIPGQQMDGIKAAYNVALAQKNAAVQGVEQAQAKLASAKVGVAQAQSRLAQAQEGVRSAQAKLATSKGGLQQASAGSQDTSMKRSQYAAAKAAIAQAEASLKDAQLQLSYTNITAPSAGRVGKKTVEVGNRIQSGSPLMAIVDNENWIVANFKETQLEKMRSGQTVEVKLDAFPHHTFIGRIDSIAPASGAQFALLPPDNATGNFTKIVQRIPVKIVLDQKSIQGYDSRMTPGMSAEVTVEVK